MPRGGLIGLVGQGIGLATEYNQHRKQLKSSRQNSQQNGNDDEAVAGPSARPAVSDRSLDSAGNPDTPPAYSDVPGIQSGRSIASGGPPSDDKKTGLAQYADDDEDDEVEDIDYDGAESLNDEAESLEDDEEDWQMDEAFGPATSDPGLPSYEESEAEGRDTDGLVREVIDASHQNAMPETPLVRKPLPCPVILPQRRPRKKTRGFVRAYAPLLDECAGIDQETFLNFLKNFHKSSQASPVFTVIRVSAAIAGMAPSVIAMAVSTVVQAGAQVGAEVQSRQRTNHYLDQMNEELFKPAGLFALIVKYKPESDLNTPSSKTDIGKRFGLRAESVNMDTNEVIAKYDRTMSDERGWTDRMRDMRLASNTTKGAMEIPLAAPLIFPAADDAITANGAEETFKDKAKDAKKFMANYFDRRAHMQYARDDPMSSLILPEEQRAFKVRWTDPDHPMYQGGLVSLVTGGAVNPNQLKQDRRVERHYERYERRALKYEQRMDHGRALHRKQQRRYDAFMDHQQRSYGASHDGGYGYDDEYDSGRYGEGYGIGRQRGLGGRRQRGGLIHNLIGVAVDAASNHGKQPAAAAPYNAASREPSTRQVASGSAGSYEHEDIYDRSAPHSYDDDHRRRSYDGRDAYQRGPSSSDLVQTLSQHGNALYDTVKGRRGGRGGRDGPGGRVRRLMREDVLYLMIVNMPSEEELAEARQALGR